MTLRIFPALVLFIFLAGCAAVSTVPEKALTPGAEKIVPASLRAEAVVEIKRVVPVSAKALVLVKSPDKFRIEVTGPLGSVMGLMLSDGETLSVFSGDEVKNYRWNDPFSPYPFDSIEAVSFLLGDQPGAANDRADYKVKRGEDGRIKEILKYKDGVPLLTARLSDYREISGAVIPFNISIEGKDTIRIRYSSVEVNPELDGSLFMIPSVH